MTPDERQRREMERIFQLGQQLAATWPPITDEQVERCAFIIRPRLAATRNQAPSTLPQVA